MSTRALQIELLADPLIDPTTGSICSGYTAYFYAAGTSTPKNVWTEKEKTNPFTSYLLDSGGKVLLYGDGIYKIVVKNVEGTTVLSLDNQKIQANTFSVVQKIDTYTATPDDDVILCNGTFTVNIQTVANFEHPLIIKNIGVGVITVDPSAAQTIDGNATIALVGGDVATLWPDTTSTIWRRDALIADLNGTELILDADGDTSITADTDDQIDVRINGADEYVITASAFDFNANELILDADADTSITADTDDQIDFKIGGTDQFSFKDGVIEPTTNNDIDLGNETGPKRIKDVNIAGTVRVAGIAQGKDVTAAIHRKIVNIGDWNMDSTGTIDIAHGLTASKIRSVTAVIVNDAGDTYYPFNGYQASAGGTDYQGMVAYWDATNVRLYRSSGSLYDAATFDSTSYNRGWLTIEYVD
jgi:hypothetical protein